MFIYCGDDKDRMVRVLDTNDGVVETVNFMSLNILRAQGHKIIKDFNYDYAYRIYNWLSSELPQDSCQIDNGYGMNNQARYYMNCIYNMCKGLTSCIDHKLYDNVVKDSVCWYYGRGLLGLFIDENGVHIQLAGKYGVFYHFFECSVDKIFHDDLYNGNFEIILQDENYNKIKVFEMSQQGKIIPRSDSF